MSALPNTLVAEFDDDAAERANLIATLEQMQPQTKLSEMLIKLRLQMLRSGQHLFTLDEINRDLGREKDSDFLLMQMC